MYKLLSTVLSIFTIKGYSFGLSTYVLILKGSNSKKIQEWMKDLTYFACMPTNTANTINEFIHKIIEYGYLEDHDVGGCIRVLRCTEYGITFCKEYKQYIE